MHSFFEYLYTDERKTPNSIQTAERKKVPEIVYVDSNSTKPKMPPPRSHIPVQSFEEHPNISYNSGPKTKRKHTHTLQSVCVFWSNFFGPILVRMLKAGPKSKV